MRTVTWQGPQAKGRSAAARALVALAAVTLAFGTLSGCVPSPDRGQAPSATATPTAQPTPVFSSDKEALAAAKTAYAEYLRVSDEILSEGGVRPERLRAVATGKALLKLTKDFAVYSKREWRTTGNTTIDSMKLQARSPHGVWVYVCEDVSNVDVLDASGDSQVSPDRDPRTPFDVEMVRRDHELLVASKTWWKERDFCR